MKSEIPLLQNVRVASPCSASWDEMTRIYDDRVRFCDRCMKRVYNLSAMGQAEAEGLLRAHEGHLCVRYYRRSDGTILTADCPVGLQAARRLVLTRARVSAGLCLLLAIGFAQLRGAFNTAEPPAVPEVDRTKAEVVGSMPAPQIEVQGKIARMPVMGAPVLVLGRRAVHHTGEAMATVELGDAPRPHRKP